MSARTMALLGIAVSSWGIFLGFYFYFQPNLELALAAVTVCTVGVLGVLGFLRHTLLHKEDAERLGWQTDHPDWQFEVGFANLGFGLVGLLAAVFSWGMKAEGALIAAYALYLLQAAGWHTYRSLSGEHKNLVRFFRSGLVTGLVALMMLFFAWVGLTG